MSRRITMLYLSLAPLAGGGSMVAAKDACLLR
jgi:hypothetical protein